MSIEIPPNSVAVTCTAPVNIAVIKYWGKKDTVQIIPTNSSLSGTLDVDVMCSRTTMIASKSYDSDAMWLNGKQEDLTKNKRTKAVIEQLKSRAEDYCDENGNVVIPKAEWNQYKIHIISHNNFPTAAGLASSASGYACFTKCLASLFNVKEAFPGELTTIARLGSGSACRSLDGGFVTWTAGDCHTNSIARQVVDEHFWPEMRVIILVANGGAKEIGSTDGMQRTVQTSPLLKYRCDVVVPERIVQMETAIKNKDFESFARLTMADSNQFHAVCLDTFPPIFYMNDTSKRIIQMIDSYNEEAGRLEAAYTYDAGPNACIYTLAHNVDKLMNMFLNQFAPVDKSVKDFVLDPLNLSTISKQEQFQFDSSLTSETLLQKVGKKHENEKVYQIIVTKLGPGARIVDRKITF